MDISIKPDSERENDKQVFTLTLKKERTLTNAVKQVAKALHQAIKMLFRSRLEPPFVALDNLENSCLWPSLTSCNSNATKYD